MYADLSGLDQMARDLEAVAAKVRTEADDHYHRARQVRWVSDAAEAYRRVALEDRRSAHSAADRLARSAQSLRRHAANVRVTLALVRRLDVAVAECVTQVIAWTR